VARKPRLTLDGSVYLLKLGIEDKVVYKVGVTSYTVANRVLGIIESVWKSYGYFPRVDILYQARTRHPYAVEASIHERLRDMGLGYHSKEEFSGSTELFQGELGEIRSVVTQEVERGQDVREETLDRISDVM